MPGYSVRVDIEYLGDLHCRATHGPSGHCIPTDAPKDNEGKGEFFSPTDLVGTAMGTCMATIMGIYARKNQVRLEGMTVTVEKFMSAEPPRRIARLEVTFRMPPGLDEKTRRCLEAAADTCPVRRSLRPEVEVPVRFEYSD